MKQLTCDICVLGCGYTGLIAGTVAAQQGVDVRVVSASSVCSSETSRTVELMNHRVSKLPIFPVERSLLTTLLELDTSANTRLRASCAQAAKLPDWVMNASKKGSFFDFMRSTAEHEDAALIIAWKQWGHRCLVEPLTLVQNKVKRHYHNGNPQFRMGYDRGLSPYEHCIINAIGTFGDVLYVHSADMSRQVMIGEDYELRYNKLVCTVEINALLRLCGYKCGIVGDFASASFVYCSYDGSVPVNTLVYDCDPLSPILRIFVPLENLLVVQLAHPQAVEFGALKVELHLKRLLPDICSAKVMSQWSQRIAYPLEPVSDKTIDVQIPGGQLKNILYFGRFSQWDYLDLHELDWKKFLKFVSDGSDY